MALNSVTWDAQCDGFMSSDPDGSYVLVNVTVTAAADATEALNINEFYFEAYAEGYSVDVGIGGLFCDVPDALPDDLQPGATATGNLMLDLSPETVWLAYSPTLGFYGPDPAWRIR
ncbi:uncharacterized protein DUF4352 [Salana multivorans]|uniref:Uncharacterized protein DUF4352 n=2 Tax=Salana multivorans TaxID=120377 RepID=A0A3N2D0K5_9MICO|nr:DUF4352 domain-containing protein [Salana multivorans]ROR93299.1 uncharacterized protein DUF4352 [Salana multivorans]